MESEKERLEIALRCSYMRWDEVAEHGSLLPHWTDGRELNYIREEIILEKKKLEHMGYFPDIYYRKTPPAKPRGYMVHGDVIREKAAETLKCYEADENYRYIWQHINQLDERQREMTGADAALYRVQELRDYIRLDNVVRMKAHEEPDKCQAYFKCCRKKMETLFQELEELRPAEKQEEIEEGKEVFMRQMELFDLIR